jgi:hypothetical protein
MRKARKILVSRTKVVRPIGVPEIVQARASGIAYVSKRPRVLDHHHIDDSTLPLFWNYLTLSDGLLTVYEVA